jgi:hypothetical protein
MLNHWLYAAFVYVFLYGESIEVTMDEADKCGRPRQGVFSDYVLKAIKLLEKFGLHFHPIMQTANALAPEIVAELLDMATVVNCHSLSDVSILKEIMGLPNLDPDRIHHWTEHKRSVPDGHDTVELTETVPGAQKFLRPDKPGFEEWSQGYDYLASDIRKRKVLVARYREEIERTPHYESLSDQLLLTARDISTLGKQQRYVRCGGRAWKETVPTLRNPYLFQACADARVDAFLEEILQRPEFTKPEIIRPTAKPWIVNNKSKK